jgi:hypothetical protein
VDSEAAEGLQVTARVFKRQEAVLGLGAGGTPGPLGARRLGAHRLGEAQPFGKREVAGREPGERECAQHVGAAQLPCGELPAGSGESIGWLGRTRTHRRAGWTRAASPALI